MKPWAGTRKWKSIDFAWSLLLTQSGGGDDPSGDSTMTDRLTTESAALVALECCLNQLRAWHNHVVV